MKFKKYFLLLCISSFITTAWAQSTQPAGANTYALVVGISGYQNAAIPKLNYADKDASLFAQWLQSKAGGSVPDYQIKLLTNENASIAAIYTALNWLQDNAGQNDNVYLYFSGHGDMEIDSASISKGYLLAYNSPPNNYSNNAVSIDDINNTANNLTIKNGAKVILITDACHSGKLAGDVFKGKQLTAKNLRAVQNTQVRMTSCADNELAAEGPAWGGGRGVFSYYLLFGLNGLADSAKNKTITVANLNSYINTAFKNDATLKKDDFKQHPVIEGNPFFPIARVDAETFASIKTGLKNNNVDFTVPPAGLQSLKSLGIQPIDFFFERAKADTFEMALDFSQYNHLPVDSVPGKIVIDFLAYLEKSLQEQMANPQKQFDEIVPKDLVSASSSNNLYALSKQLSSLKNVIFRFNEKFVQMVQTKGQDMINAYLKGDLAEMERRQYYYSGTRTYTNFLKQLQLARKLVNPGNYMSRILALQYSYLAGLNCRLAMETTLVTDSLLKAAFAHQFEALRLDPYAPYVNNEIGNLYDQKNMYDSADYHFSMASTLAPTWAIPWSNKIKMNFAANKIAKAKEAINMAIVLQPSLGYVKLNAGLVMEKDGDLLSAESYYLQAIAQNNIHYLPFERLGKLYIRTGEIGKADYYLYQANRRKESFTINDKMFSTGKSMLAKAFLPLNEDYCQYSVPENLTLKAYADLHEALRMMAEEGADTNLMIKQLKDALKTYKNLPLAHHYLGKIYFHKGDLIAAENELKFAVQDYKDNTSLKRYLYDSLVGMEHTVELNCLAEKLLDQLYNETEDHYMLADLYQKRGSNDEALKHYKQVIRIENKQLLDHASLTEYKRGALGKVDFLKYKNDTASLTEATKEYYEKPPTMGGYLKAALLYEASGKYFEAEKVLLDQISMVRLAADSSQEFVDRKTNLHLRSNVNYYWFLISRDVEAATYLFYKRMLAMDPLNPDPVWKEKTALFLYNRLALSYNQIPVSEQYSFYNAIITYKDYLGGTSQYTAPLLYKSMRKYAYPWLTLPGTIEYNKTFKVQLPGSNQTVQIDVPDFDPVKSAVHLMEQAIKLSGDLKARRELAEAMADLYSWSGRADEALALYDVLVTQFPTDASLRNKLIDNLVSYGHLPEARHQLDSLFLRKQIKNIQLPVLARYHLLSGEFEKADQTMEPFMPINATLKNEMIKFFVHKNISENNAKKALKYLIDSLRVPEIKEFNEWKQNYAENEEAFFRLYSIAVTYEQLNKKDKAIKALENLLNAGFMYKFVLENDQVWDKRRDTKSWADLLKKYEFKIDYSRKTADDLNKGRWFTIPLVSFDTGTR